MTWIKHTPGDPMPVPGDTVVEVRFRNGDVFGPEPAGSRLWSTSPREGCQITAYRIVEPAKPAARDCLTAGMMRHLARIARGCADFQEFSNALWIRNLEPEASDDRG